MTCIGVRLRLACRTLKATDRQIDALEYELTEEEIAIVEEATDLSR